MGGVELLIMLAMIAFNSIFAAYELALAAVSAGRLDVLAHQGRPGARAALYMKTNVECSLAAIQLGITLFGAIAAATGGAGAEEVLSPWLQARLGLTPGGSELLAVAAVVLPLTAFTIVFGELVPKVFALRNKERVCLALSPAMRWFTFSVWPAVRLFETIVSAITAWGQRRLHEATGTGTAGRDEAAELLELQASATLARTARIIGLREEGIILGAARLSRRSVREIMLPADAISMLDLNAPLEDALVAAHLDMHTRYPVTDTPGDPQGIVGYINFKDLVAALRLAPRDPSLRGIARPLASFAEADSIAACLERLLRDGRHIALVRDPAGRVTGLVTLEDVVEELLGDITDEYDRSPTHIAAAGTSWLVGGGITLDRLRLATGLDLAPPPAIPHSAAPEAPVRRLGEWIATQLGRPARRGDVLERHGVRLVIRKVRRHQVVEAQLSRTD